jgi:hypothetical protein
VGIKIRFCRKFKKAVKNFTKPLQLWIDCLGL